jgi:hypothetical protein
VEVVPFARNAFDIDKMEKKLKGTVVFIQAPEKYQTLVDEFYKNLMPWEIFLFEISRRTGVERPEKNLFWVALLYACYNRGIKVKLIEPDIDKLIAGIPEKLGLGPGKTLQVLQDTRLWFLSSAGFIKHFNSAFDSIFFFLPAKSALRNAWLGLAGLVAHLIPGDQKDVMYLVSKIYRLLPFEMAKNLKGPKDALVFVEEAVAGKMEKLILEAPVKS